MVRPRQPPSRQSPLPYRGVARIPVGITQKEVAKACVETSEQTTLSEITRKYPLNRSTQALVDIKTVRLSSHRRSLILDTRELGHRKSVIPDD